MELELHTVKLKSQTQIRGFHCREKELFKPLENFLCNHALDNQKKSFSVTWLVCNRDEEVLAYFTLICASIKKEQIPSDQRERHPRYEEYPSIKIARLAVKDGYRRLGIGKFMMIRIFTLVLIQSEYIGCRYIIVDSKNNKETLQFYKKFGYIEVIPDNGATDTISCYKDVITIFGSDEKEKQAELSV